MTLYPPLNFTNLRHKHDKVCQIICPKCNHSHTYGINMRKIIQNLFNFHYETMGHSIEFIVSYTLNARNCNIRKFDEKYVPNWLDF
jgi:hypothetical protein